MPVIALHVLVGLASALFGGAGMTWMALNPAGTTTTFHPHACQRVETYVGSHVLGQELGIRQLVETVCTHVAKLERNEPTKPLVMSVHGPPGVGKTYSHMLLAKALYSKEPSKATNCPGKDCTGYKVVQGLHFIDKSRLEQLEAVKQAILSHCENVRDPLVVIEEYDKIDCTTRRWLRDLLAHANTNKALSRAIILLESNVGFLELQRLVTEVGDRTKVTIEQAEEALKDSLFQTWSPKKEAQADSTEACEDDWTSNVRFTSSIRAFLPYLPLQRPQIEELMHHTLLERKERLLAQKGVHMSWESSVVSWLVNKVKFDEGFSIDGAKPVDNIAGRYLDRVQRRCSSNWQLMYAQRYPEKISGSTGYRREQLNVVEQASGLFDSQLLLKVDGSDLKVVYPGLSLPAS